MQADQNPIVLVVDDEEALLLFASDVLEEAGFKVLTATNSLEALLILESANIEVLLADVGLPGEINGLELVARVRHKWPRVKSFIVSGRSNLTEACRAGANGFIGKPFTAADIVNATRVLTVPKRNG